MTHVIVGAKGKARECFHLGGDSERERIVDTITCAVVQPWRSLAKCRLCSLPLAAHVSLDDHTRRCVRAKLWKDAA